MGYGAGLASGYGAGRGTGYGAGAGGRYGAGSGSGYGAGLASGAAAFSPSDITGLVLELKPNGVFWQDSARTTPVTADGDPIGSWDDSSGSGSHALQATAGLRPLYKTNIVNGSAAVLFDNTDDTLDATLTADATCTYFIVGKFISGDGKTMAFWAVDAQLHKQSASGAGVLYFDGSFHDLGGTPTNFNVIVLRVNSAASLDGYVNGGTATNFNPVDSITTSVSLKLGEGGSGNPGNCYIAHVLKYDTALNATNVNLAGNYLAGLYGLTWSNIS